MQNKPPRRKRYPGTHPKQFEDRYKELNPAEYPDEQEKVRAQGRTPAGTHVPILLAEILSALHPQAGETVLDCTVGYGGHAEALAGTGARVIGIDIDGVELQRTTARLASLGLSLSPHHTNFAGIGGVLAAEQIIGVDCLLADLGVSSMQLDQPSRGFAFKHDGPLDMRMDDTRGRTALEFIHATEESALAELLRDFADEPKAEALAHVLKRETPRTTHALAGLVLRVHGLDPDTYRKENARDKHPAARVFQALRMAVNREAANLAELLRVLPASMNPGGRVAILTFHSGEERKVRDTFKDLVASGVFATAELTGMRAGKVEIYNNPRARSARLFTSELPA